MQFILSCELSTFAKNKASLIELGSVKYWKICLAISSMLILHCLRINESNCTVHASNSLQTCLMNFKFIYHA
jgi:hypothetical protein